MYVGNTRECVCFSKKTGELNSMKIFSKMADILKINIGVQPFRFFNRFKMAVVSMTSFTTESYIFYLFTTYGLNYHGESLDSS